MTTAGLSWGETVTLVHGRAGHDWQKYVSEIGIPTPVISAGKNLADLPTAGTLQPFRDVRGGGGLLYLLQEIPRTATHLDAVPPLLYSSAATDEPPSHTITNYRHADEWTGGAWITAEDRTAVVFVGTKGTGDC